MQPNHPSPYGSPPAPTAPAKKGKGKLLAFVGLGVVSVCCVFPPVGWAGYNRFVDNPPPPSNVAALYEDHEDELRAAVVRAAEECRGYVQYSLGPPSDELLARIASQQTPLAGELAGVSGPRVREHPHLTRDVTVCGMEVWTGDSNSGYEGARVNGPVFASTRGSTSGSVSNLWYVENQTGVARQEWRPSQNILGMWDENNADEVRWLTVNGRTLVVVAAHHRTAGSEGSSMGEATILLEFMLPE